jgi:5'-nucleotidase
MSRPTALVSLIFASLGVATLPWQLRSEGEAAVTVQLLAINDFHGNLEPPSGSNGRIGDTPAGGAEYLATHLKSAIAENTNSIVVAAGDLIGASPLVSALFHDEPTIESMNAINLAVSSVGNHEFDKGAAELLRLQRQAQFRYRSANVVRGSAAAQALFPATAVRTVGGVRLGFIGETLRDTSQIVAPAGIQGLRFLVEASAANSSAARLKRQGVNAIVLLLHQGG